MKYPTVTRDLGSGVIMLTLTDCTSEENFRNGTPVIIFSVNLIVAGLKLIEIPNVKLIDGRIQLPDVRKRIAGGEIRQKVVQPIYALLKLIHDAIQGSDWYEQYPKLPALVPIVKRTDDPSEAIPDDQDDLQPPQRYLDPRRGR